MKRQRRFHLGTSAVAIAAGFSMLMLFSSVDARAGGDQVSASTADHAKFEALNKPFVKAQDVTRACLSCHNEAGKQVQQTYHWTWQAKGGLQKGIGKKNVLNNF